MTLSSLCKTISPLGSGTVIKHLSMWHLWYERKAEEMKRHG